MPLIATRGAASVQGFGEFAQTAAPVYIEDVFSTYLYIGNASTQTITNNIDLSGKGGLVWIKSRSNAFANALIDTARGREYVVSSNLTDAQYGPAPSDKEVTSFNSNGFSLGTNYNFSINTNAATYASWTFREQPKFFDIVTYTGNSSNRTISHNLGSVPGCMIIKSTSTTYNWRVYHRSLGNTKFLTLDTTAAEDTGATLWNNTTPTSTEFTVGTASSVNSSGETYVAYLFAHDAGGFGLTGSDNVITCGSYTGNGSTSGPTVTLGYEPQWLMIKAASTTGSWQIIDNMRGMVVGGNDQRLIANSSSAELTNDYLSPTATGFQLVSTSSEVNGNGQTYIYIAIRRGPMKTPTSGTSVFYPKVHAGTSSYSVGFPTDLCLAADQSGNALNTVAVYRLAGNNAYFGGTASTAAEVSVSVCQFDLQNSFQLSYNNNNQARWHFRRAPGFFDVVCFTSNGSAGATFSHNLAAVPELLIVKSRGTVGDWYVFGRAVGSDASGQWYMKLNLTSALSAYAALTTNTSSSVTIANGTLNDTNATQVAYLFASVSGVSKVGSYTGTGALQTVNCGFTGGARFVLIKRTDSTGDWYVYDSARGISSGNDPYLLLNSTAAEVTNTDYVDTYSAGFEISSTAPAAINANGGTFIFLAIA